VVFVLMMKGDSSSRKKAKLENITKNASRISVFALTDDGPPAPVEPPVVCTSSSGAGVSGFGDSPSVSLFPNPSVHSINQVQLQQPEQQEPQQSEHRRQGKGRKVVDDTRSGKSERGRAVLDRKDGEHARKRGLNVTSWSPADDRMLMQLVDKYGTRSWSTLSRVYFDNKRTATQLRSRYADVLFPGRKREPWTKAEDELLFVLHAKHGNKWSAIADDMKGCGRVSNDVKNRHRFLVRKMMESKFNSSTAASTDENHGS